MKKIILGLMGVFLLSSICFAASTVERTYWPATMRDEITYMLEYELDNWAVTSGSYTDLTLKDVGRYQSLIIDLTEASTTNPTVMIRYYEVNPANVLVTESITIAVPYTLKKYGDNAVIRFTDATTGVAQTITANVFTSVSNPLQPVVNQNSSGTEIFTDASRGYITGNITEVSAAGMLVGIADLQAQITDLRATNNAIKTAVEIMDDWDSGDQANVTGSLLQDIETAVDGLESLATDIKNRLESVSANLAILADWDSGDQANVTGSLLQDIETAVDGLESLLASPIETSQNYGYQPAFTESDPGIQQPSQRSFQEQIHEVVGTSSSTVTASAAGYWTITNWDSTAIVVVSFDGSTPNASGTNGGILIPAGPQGINSKTYGKYISAEEEIYYISDIAGTTVNTTVWQE